MNCELEVDECGSQPCLHCAMILVGITSLTTDSLETSVNSTLMNVPVSQVSMEENTPTVTKQILDSQGHTVRL